MGEFAQGPGAAAQNAATAAENAQLDARLEIAAKKAAVQSLEAQAGGAVPQAPGVPGLPGGRVVIERDGKTIILDNPTAEQLQAINGAGTATPPLEGWALVAISGMTVATVLIVIATVFKYLTRPQRGQSGTAQDEARMARIENAIESIAVEVERISEGQRYAARVLSEGAAQPVVGVAQGERVMRNNGED